MPEFVLNSAARDTAERAEPTREPIGVHERLPDYAPGALVSAPSLAERAGVGSVMIKDASRVLGLPAFKILGASWAGYRVLEQRLGRPFEPWSSLEQLAIQIEPLLPLALITASDGNHGRAVARLARWLGMTARIFLPAGTARARVEAIVREGAEVSLVDGSYDETVARAAASRTERALLIQDTAWRGYERIPGWITEGYSTLFWETEQQLAASAEPGPDMVLVPVGVGSLAAAAVRHFRHSGRQGGAQPQRIVSIEPLGAACLLRSIAAGRPVSVAGAHGSMMAGLNCGTVSSLAWPVLENGIDAAVGLEDEWAAEAMRALAEIGLAAGESGAASAAGLLALGRSSEAGAESARRRLGLGPKARVLVLMTEGPTDPDNYRRVVEAGR
ncbi:MAG: diaminopropionate ammonia-lyase [Acidobacteriota bacterium]|nr:MAG: diaminopropionate ammonia-lyase [Acidobacteriota bacterium]